MLTYIIRRLLLMIPTLIGMTLVMFLVMALSPGGVGGQLASEDAGMRPEELAARRAYYNRRYGLDKPVLVQYGRWLNQVSPIGFPTYDEDVIETIKDADGKETQVMVRDSSGKMVPKVKHRMGDIYFSLWKTFQVDVAETTTDDNGNEVEVKETKADGKLVPKIKYRKDDRIFWLFKKPDLGESFVRNRPVITVIMDALPVTLLLNILAIPIIYSVSLTAGIYSARYRGKLVDISLGTIFLGLWSIPTMWTGVVLIGYFANRDFLQLFPTGGLHDPMAAEMSFLPRYAMDGHWEQGFLLDTFWHLVLPLICMVYTGFAFASKMMRSAMLENMSSDFVRTARAKGLKDRAVLFHHVFRNSLLPLITMATHLIPGLLGGSVIIESIFSLNGMGSLMVDAIMKRDRELILGEAIIVSAISLLCLLVADLLYSVADPRVSYD